MTSWEAVWEARRLDPAAASTLAALMAADGLDTGFGSVSEEHWTSFVRSVETTLRLEPGRSVFEVGCGAGAFLYDLYTRGYHVGGIDRSAALVGYARSVMPNGRFDVAEAAGLGAEERWDAVVACGVFLYFPSLDYASDVIARMVEKARHCVAILDLPDAARSSEALAHRQAAIGGPKAYAERYRGLEHLSFDRSWVAEALEGSGLVGVQVVDQAIPGYDNGRFRFNAWGFCPPAPG